MRWYKCHMSAAEFSRTLEAVLGQAGVGPIAAATRAGLPKDAIRSVLRGHPPSIHRADDICHALGITLTLGPAPPVPLMVREDAEPCIMARPPNMPGALWRKRRQAAEQLFEPVRDRRLAELLARLADGWEAVLPAERERLAAGVAAVLDLVGAVGGRRLAALSSGWSGR